MPEFKTKVIFDVGAYDGADGIMLALKNKNYLVYAFEANPYQCTIIKSNKRILEKRIRRKIYNYKLFNLAVSNFNGTKIFNISKNPTVSSLKKFRKNVFKNWPGYQEHFFVEKKIKVKVITLNKFCIENNIEKISYLHCDSQGNDLNVLKGLGSYLQKTARGVIESSINKNRSIYKNNHTFKQVKSFFFKNGFRILKCEEISGTMGNELNIHFKKNNINLDNINLIYNCRYLKRVFSGKTYLKDDIKDFFIRYYNIRLKSYLNFLFAKPSIN